MKRLILIPALALAACESTQTPEPIIRTVEVRVPYDDPACARAAKAQLGPPPAYPDSDEALRAAANIRVRAGLLMAGRELRRARGDAVEAALMECAR